MGHLHDENSELGAEHLTQSTRDATLGIQYLGGVISLGIEKIGHL
jgi:hypothetical protein